MRGRQILWGLCVKDDICATGKVSERMRISANFKMSCEINWIFRKFQDSGPEQKQTLTIDDAENENIDYYAHESEGKRLQMLAELNKTN